MIEEMDQEGGGLRATDLLLAFVGGAALGAGVALLLAPRSGEETRSSLRSLAKGAKDWFSSGMEGGDEGGDGEEGAESLGAAYSEA